MPEFQEGKNRSDMWATILAEFVGGWPEGEPPSQKQLDMIELFLNSTHYQNMILEFHEKELKNGSYKSYTNRTKV